MTTRELDVILTKRPKLNDLEIGDLLHNNYTRYE